MKEALYWEKMADGRIKCVLCPKDCSLRDGQDGFCGIRGNRGGKLQAFLNDQVAVVEMDPIEKKTFYHYYPGTQILSLGNLGCNFRCPFCQNWMLIEKKVGTKTLKPQEAVKMAMQKKSIGIAFTYNEPFIWFEYILETAKLAKKYNLKTVMVSNGYHHEKPSEHLLQYIDAINIDLKYSNPKTYRKSLGNLDVVLKTIERANKLCHVEITHLLVPTLNDTAEDMKMIGEMVGEIDPLIPLHIARYRPLYKFKEPRTSLESLEEAYSHISSRLKYVYINNVEMATGKHTYCHECNNLLINRQNGLVKIIGVKSDGTCSRCGSNSARIKIGIPDYQFGI